MEKLEKRAEKGEDVKDSLEKTKTLLSGEIKEKKMLEERADQPWISAAGKFIPDSSKNLEYLHSEYMTEHELSRKHHKEDLERPAKDQARWKLEVSKLGSQLEKGEGNAENIKRRVEFLKKMIAAKIPKPDDIKPFKPPSVFLASAQCVEIF